jgi:hypothetical protein
MNLGRYRVYSWGFYICGRHFSESRRICHSASVAKGRYRWERGAPRIHVKAAIVPEEQVYCDASKTKVD